MGHGQIGESVTRSAWEARYNLGAMVLCYSILCAILKCYPNETWDFGEDQCVCVCVCNGLDWLWWGKFRWKQLEMVKFLLARFLRRGVFSESEYLSSFFCHSIVGHFYILSYTSKSKSSSCFHNFILSSISQKHHCSELFQFSVIFHLQQLYSHIYLFIWPRIAFLSCLLDFLWSCSLYFLWGHSLLAMTKLFSIPISFSVDFPFTLCIFSSFPFTKTELYS